MSEDAVNVLDHWDGARTERGLIDLSAALPKAVAAARAEGRGEVMFPAGVYDGHSVLLRSATTEGILLRGETSDPGATLDLN